MDDSMLVLVRKEFWEQSVPISPFIDTEELYYHKAKNILPQKRHFLAEGYQLWPVGRSRVYAFQ